MAEEKSEWDHLKGKHAFAPYLCTEEGKQVPRVIKLVCGEHGMVPLKDKRYDTFDDAEEAADEMNEKLGLDEDDIWLIVEVTLYAN